MGSWWSSEDEGDFFPEGEGTEEVLREHVDVSEIPKLCGYMHARYRSLGRMNHWTLARWYRQLGEDGHLAPQRTYFEEPLCVCASDDGLTYRMVTEIGDVVYTLPTMSVAEFEDTIYSIDTLSDQWKETLQCPM